MLFRWWPSLNIISAIIKTVENKVKGKKLLQIQLLHIHLKQPSYSLVSNQASTAFPAKEGLVGRLK